MIDVVMRQVILKEIRQLTVSFIVISFVTCIYILVTGHRDNRWSTIMIRIGKKEYSNVLILSTFTVFCIALAIFLRSPAAYEALKSFNILQLPSRSTLQSYTGAFLHIAGANSSCIADQVAHYLLFCQQQKAQERKEQKGDGALIFDKVKVISRLMWNSRSQTLIGLSMDHDELSSLSDIYSCADGKCPEQTSYILQFLW